MLIAFGTTIVLWVFPGLLALVGLGQTAFGGAYAQAVPESFAALIGAFLLFLLPLDLRSGRFTLTWNEALNIDWGIILLYGAGWHWDNWPLLPAWPRP